GSLGKGGTMDGTPIAPLETVGWGGCAWSASVEGGAIAGLKLRLGAGATLRLLAFRCASANGMTQTARSRSTYNALRIKCALIVRSFCFFIYSCSPLNVPCLNSLVKPEELFELLTVDRIPICSQP